MWNMLDKQRSRISYVFCFQGLTPFRLDFILKAQQALWQALGLAQNQTATVAA
jgi:hypothetical protein